MSTKVLSLCWEYPAETAAEKLILLKIGDQSNDKGQSIYFSMETYARAGALKSTRGAQKILRRLEEKGILLDDPEFEADLRARGKAVRARVYRLNLEKMQADIDAATPAVIDAWEDEKAGDPENKSDAISDAEGELSSPSGEGVRVNSVHPEGELSSPNPFLESFTNTPPISPSAVSAFAEDFDALWEAWRPVKEEKGYIAKARQEYELLRNAGASARAIQRKAEDYIRLKQATGDRTKHLENWLKSQGVEGFEERGSARGAYGKSAAKKAAPEPVARRPRLKEQAWREVARVMLGEAVFRSWIEPLWLEGSVMHCPTRFISEWVEKNYHRAIVRAAGFAVTYIVAPPPDWALAESFVTSSTGGIHDSDEKKDIEPLPAFAPSG